MNCQPGGRRTGYYLAIAPRPTLIFIIGAHIEPGCFHVRANETANGGVGARCVGETDSEASDDATRTHQPRTNSETATLLFLSSSAYAVTTWFDDARGLAVGLTFDTEEEGDRVTPIGGATL